MSTVLACGVAVLDVQQTVDRLPGPDEKLVASDLLVTSGGPAANAAALGVSARLVTRIDHSALGTLISADLAAYGVDVVDRAGPLDQPAVSTVLVTRGTGQRAVVSVNSSRHGATLFTAPATPWTGWPGLRASPRTRAPQLGPGAGWPTASAGPPPARPGHLTRPQAPPRLTCWAMMVCGRT